MFFYVSQDLKNLKKQNGNIKEILSPSEAQKTVLLSHRV